MRHNALFFLCLSAASLLVVCVKIQPPRIPSTARGGRTIRVNLYPQGHDLKSLSDAEDRSRRLEFYIDSLQFPIGKELSHVHLGPLGFTEDFLLEINTELEVTKATDYVFSVWSDDGFMLRIDGNDVAGHAESRPYAETQAVIRLNAGRHLFHLSYFQGYGPLGLTVLYREQRSNGAWVPIGQSSERMRFRLLGQ